jgi:hypothetical protein
MNDFQSPLHAPVEGKGYASPSPSRGEEETLILGIGSRSQFVEEPRGNPPMSYPHGLLPTPPDVRAVVAKEETRLLETHGLVLSPQAHQSLVNEQTLSHFLGGQWISYRETTQGPDVLAVGLEEIGRLMQLLGPQELLTVRTRQI